MSWTVVFCGFFMRNSDKIWICTYKLKEYGIDIEEWNKERIKKGKE